MKTTMKAGNLLDRGTVREIERFLRARRLDLAQLIRRGLGDREEKAGDDGDVEAAASRTLQDAVRAARVDRASHELGQVDAALELLRERRYGLCRECAAFIGVARLRSLPFAQRCRPCQERAERVQALEARRSLVLAVPAEPA
jgi:RNA polymerase-binding transcription factor DksA